MSNDKALKLRKGSDAHNRRCAEIDWVISVLIGLLKTARDERLTPLQARCHSHGRFLGKVVHDFAEREYFVSCEWSDCKFRFNITRSFSSDFDTGEETVELIPQYLSKREVVLVYDNLDTLIEEAKDLADKISPLSADFFNEKLNEIIEVAD